MYKVLFGVGNLFITKQYYDCQKLSTTMALQILGEMSWTKQKTFCFLPMKTGETLISKWGNLTTKLIA